jgi:uncharacterized membrane protein
MKYRFLIYGLLGWILEIIWTGLGSAFQGDVRLVSVTYLWMFPIYGMAVFMEPIHERIRPWPWFFRGTIWVMVIWFIEFTAGGLIRLVAGASPWDYAGSTPWHIHGLIRLDMAPVWFAGGLLFERVHDFLTRDLKI